MAGDRQSRRVAEDSMADQSTGAVMPSMWGSLDDGALGTAHLLCSYPGSTVVTVCAGRPPAYPDPPSDWDALGGFRTGDDVVAIRREEDRVAMRVLDADPVWL